MGTIFYAVSGEGRGHATRAVTLIEDLRIDHRVVLYAPDLAYDMLEPHYRDSEVEVREIPGLRFHYSAGRRLQYVKTGWKSLGYIAALPGLLERLERDFELDRPDLVLTDFEPGLPRAAWGCEQSRRFHPLRSARPVRVSRRGRRRRRFLARSTASRSGSTHLRSGSTHFGHRSLPTHFGHFPSAFEPVSYAGA